ncbi:Arc family DNA-binding protein [Xanthobacter versatilis]|uniref:Arc family DNA-binding protein n=1 Tax=Xanthobacter autotrophicus (strain ATCC BAA-1158 / Py2) TaxID=78245 RepID=UPI0037272AA7
MIDKPKIVGTYQRFNAKLPERLYEALQDAAFSNHRPMNDELVARLLRSFQPNMAKENEEAEALEAAYAKAVFPDGTEMEASAALREGLLSGRKGGIESRTANPTPRPLGDGNGEGARLSRLEAQMQEVLTTLKNLSAKRGA